VAFEHLLVAESLPTALKRAEIRLGSRTPRKAVCAQILVPESGHTLCERTDIKTFSPAPWKVLAYCVSDALPAPLNRDGTRLFPPMSLKMRLGIPPSGEASFAGGRRAEPKPVFRGENRGSIKTGGEGKATAGPAVVSGGNQHRLLGLNSGTHSLGQPLICFARPGADSLVTAS